MRLLHCLILLVLLAACAQHQLIDDNYTVVTPPGEENGTVRPDIPRTEPPDVERLYPEPAYRTPPELRSFLNVQTHARTSEVGVIVGDYEEPFLIGMTIGELVPILGRGDLEMLTTRMPTWQGRSLEAESYLRFDFEENSTGELRYEVLDGSEELEPFLLFEDEKPMFELAYLLHEGAFPAMVGESIDFFGTDYIIHEARNTSITLYGAEAEQYLYLVNGSGLSINGDELGDTEVRVDPWSVTITYYAPEGESGDGIRVKEGEGLREKLQRPEILLYPLFDIRFDGFEQGSEDTLTFEQRDDGVRLTFTNILGEETSFTLLSTGRLSVDNGTSFVWGDGEDALHLKECDAGAYCIKEDERFAIETQAGVSRIMEVRSLSRTRLRLRDLATDEDHEVKLVDSGDEVDNITIYKGMLDFGSGFHDVEVYYNESDPSLRIDLNEDGGLSGDSVSLFTPNVEIEPQDDFTVVLRQPELAQVDEEELLVNFTDEFLVSVNVSLAELEEDDTWQAVTPRGAVVTLEDNDDDAVGEELRVAFPLEFRPGLVRILG